MRERAEQKFNLSGLSAYRYIWNLVKCSKIDMTIDKRNFGVVSESFGLESNKHESRLRLPDEAVSLVDTELY